MMVFRSRLVGVFAVRVEIKFSNKTNTSLFVVIKGWPQGNNHPLRESDRLDPALFCYRRDQVAAEDKKILEGVVIA